MCNILKLRLNHSRNLYFAHFKFLYSTQFERVKLHLLISFKLFIYLFFIVFLTPIPNMYLTSSRRVQLYLLVDIFLLYFLHILSCFVGIAFSTPFVSNMFYYIIIPTKSNFKLWSTNLEVGSIHLKFFIIISLNYFFYN